MTPDGRTVVFVRGTETNEAGRVAAPTNDLTPRKQMVFAMEVDGDSPRALGEMGCGEEGCEDVQLSPDGRIRRLGGAQAALDCACFRRDSRTPADRSAGQQHVAALVARWPPHRVRQRSRRPQLHWRSTISATTRSATSRASVDRDGAPRWSPDGKQVAFLRVAGHQAEAGSDSRCAAAVVDLGCRRSYGNGASSLAKRQQAGRFFPGADGRRFIPVSVQRPPGLRLGAGWLEPSLFRRN